ncbi:hypothetical protein PS834_01753 [Pseudomonas fluorescens]|nr:hypothetical protein PS834_01753 [Pseudomonas fluorescens]
MVSTNAISKSMSSDTANPAITSAVFPATWLGGNADSQIIAVRSIRYSAASSLASNIACSITWGASRARAANSAAWVPRRSMCLAGSLRMSCTNDTLSHTPEMADQVPANIPLPMALALEACQCGLNPLHSLRSQACSSAVKPS